MRDLGWDRCDVILVTGDAYIDSPYIGAAVVGRALQAAGFRVGVIAQPDAASDADIARLGAPRLFWGVTGGSFDSMVANYTASGKRRKSDDMTPGGENTRRPDRAVIAYANLIRRHFKPTAPIVLGGIEASLRRVSHYDAWSNAIRRSILFDAKADLLVYGMGEATAAELARRLHRGEPIDDLRGICYIRREIPEPDAAFPEPVLELPPHEIVREDHHAFIAMFHALYDNADPVSAVRLVQRQDTRYLVQNPPRPVPSPAELDRIYERPYTRDLHPHDARRGHVKALDTIRFSLTTHRGCYGECRFCAIAVHQGRRVISRSEDSLVREAESFRAHPDFKGIISDVGGPTANMYGFDCARKGEKGACVGKSCLYPNVCKRLPVDHGRQIALLRRLSELPGVRKVFVGSGLRYDLILADKKAGDRYLRRLLRHHVSGQLKIAPEHVSEAVLSRMGKPGPDRLRAFVERFESVKNQDKLNLFLTYYLMAAHPGCGMDEMRELREFCLKHLKVLPEQAQIFTPSPSTWSTLMFVTGIDPFSGEKLFVERDRAGKARQKDVLKGRNTSGERSGAREKRTVTACKAGRDGKTKGEAVVRGKTASFERSGERPGDGMTGSGNKRRKMRR